jgi:hypothetical protein
MFYIKQYIITSSFYGYKCNVTSLSLTDNFRFLILFFVFEILQLEARLPNEKIISYFKDSPVFRNLIHLKLLFYHYYGWEWDDVTDALHHCLNLQILFIDKVCCISVLLFLCSSTLNLSFVLYMFGSGYLRNANAPPPFNKITCKIT